MLRVMFNEVHKLLAMKKIYIFLGVIFIVSIFNLILALVTNSYFKGSGYGQMLPLILFDSVSTLIFPMFIIIMIANLVTDEYVDGSLKLPLIRKVKRNQLLSGKLCAIGVVLLGLMLILLILGYSLGIVFFGWGESFLVKGKAYSTLAGVTITVSTYLISLLSYISFGTIILLFALLINNSASAVGIGMGILFSSLILDYMIPIVAPYLISNYFNSYRLLVEGFSIQSFLVMFVTILGYGLLFYSLSLFVFKRKDILT